MQGGESYSDFHYVNVDYIRWVSVGGPFRAYARSKYLHFHKDQ